jgi:3-hydroxyisobutyrate dehydrogenase-like beta-hydroxyacid dehydrogenase
MTTPTTIALLHPGEMGAGVGAVLRENGHRVLYASRERSHETSIRAMRAGLLDVGSVDKLADAPVILSICPPHAALKVARQFHGFTGFYIDANAISPEAAESVRRHVESEGGRYVDGGIIGSPPNPERRPTLYLSGSDAAEVAPLFASELLDAQVLEGSATAASALKMSYASWTKGSSALLLASLALARSYGVEEALLREWNGGATGSTGVSELAGRVRSAAGSSMSKGWRWVGEMDEIAQSYRSVGLPDGFHAAAAEIYRRSPFDPAGHADDDSVDAVVRAIVEAPSPTTSA